MNSKMELPYPEWQSPLQEMLMEFDREKLVDKALKAETLIFDRLQKLQVSRDGHEERDAIHHGLSLLRTIRRERLDYPDWQ